MMCQCIQSKQRRAHTHTFAENFGMSPSNCSMNRFSTGMNSIVLTSEAWHLSLPSRQSWITHNDTTKRDTEELVPCGPVAISCWWFSEARLLLIRHSTDRFRICCLCLWFIAALWYTIISSPSPTICWQLTSGAFGCSSGKGPQHSSTLGGFWMCVNCSPETCWVKWSIYLILSNGVRFYTNVCVRLGRVQLLCFLASWFWRGIYCAPEPSGVGNGSGPNLRSSKLIGFTWF